MPTHMPHQLERVVTIGAPPEAVFRFFTDSARWARWWGPGSTIEPRVGGDVYIRYPNGVEVRGAVETVAPPSRLVFTYGFVSGTPMPPGSSRVTITLAPDARGTRLSLMHEFADQGARDEHVQGWRFQLSLFANVVADEQAARAADAVDAWFALWSEPEASARERQLSAIADAEIRMQDRFSNLAGRDDVLPHITAALRFMPGQTLRRSGDIRHCQGMVLADWVATGPDNATRGAGTNVFLFGPTGLIEWVTGFWR